MKTLLIPLALLAISGLQAEESEVPKPTYQEEAPLPEGWPQPGPYDVVSEKELPAYRAAFTKEGQEFGAFWTLFSHITKEEIPMTAPVEMVVEGEEMKKVSMGFFYQNTEVGTAGPAGGRVEVRDVPPARALAYTWQGPDSKQNVARAKTALEAALAEKGRTATGFRLLGYNGPGTPIPRRTWELQALLGEEGEQPEPSEKEAGEAVPATD